MLQFTDLNQYHHFIDVVKVSNVVVRPQDQNFIATFYFIGAPLLVAHVNKDTAHFIKFELANHGVTNHES